MAVGARLKGPVVARGVGRSVAVEHSRGVTLAREDWKQWAQSRKAARFLDERLWADDGPVRLKVQKRSFAGAEAGSRIRAGCGQSARSARRAGRGIEFEVEALALKREPPVLPPPQLARLTSAPQTSFLPGRIVIDSRRNIASRSA